jgi:hypothetical protein
LTPTPSPTPAVVAVAKVQHYTYSDPELENQLTFLPQGERVTVLCLQGDAVKTRYERDGSEIIAWSRTENVTLFSIPDWISKTTDCP